MALTRVTKEKKHQTNYSRQLAKLNVLSHTNLTYTFKRKAKVIFKNRKVDKNV